MEKQNLERINELSRLARVRPLTDEEARERQALREQYVADFRGRLRAQLENTFVQYPDGTRVPLKDARRNPK